MNVAPSELRPLGYLEPEEERETRRHMLLACGVCLVGVLFFVLADFAWHVLMALMVVHSLVR